MFTKYDFQIRWYKIPHFVKVKFVSPRVSIFRPHQFLMGIKCQYRSISDQCYYGLNLLKHKQTLIFAMMVNQELPIIPIKIQHTITLAADCTILTFNTNWNMLWSKYFELILIQICCYHILRCWWMECRGGMLLVWCDRCY